MNRLRIIAAALLAAAAPTGPAAEAAAQAPAAPPTVRDEEVIVTGTRDRNRAISEFVEAVTIDTDGQIARFATPVCPASFGLPPGHNEVITARVRQIADHMGVGVGPDGCRPIVIVVVAERGADFIHRLHAERPDLFSALELAEVRRVMRLQGPVRAWQIVEPRGADGRPMDPISFIEMNGRLQYIGRAHMLRGVMPSLTQRATRQDLALSFIVLDLEALEGLTLLQIADHVAMRALARTEVAAAPARRSILGLFADRAAGAAPAGALTDWDAAYLSALYRTGNRIGAHQQGTNIARTMRRELESPPDGPSQP